MKDECLEQEKDPEAHRPLPPFPHIVTPHPEESRPARASSPGILPSEVCSRSLAGTRAPDRHSPRASSRVSSRASAV
eukprot:gene7031-biopygen11408